MDRKLPLPEELQIKILVRLSVRSLIRFKSVCKDWHYLIGSPPFITQHRRISDAWDNDKVICHYKDPISETSNILLLNHQTTETIAELEWPPLLDEMAENEEPLQRVLGILGPVNGVYCIFNRLIERWLGTLVLWIPSTKHYKQIVPPVRLPFPDRLINAIYNSHWDHFALRRPLGLDLGFAFSDNSNDFKLVVISHWESCYEPDDDHWHVRIYNLSTDSWKTIYYLSLYNDALPPFQGLLPPFPLINSCPTFAHCLLNGVCHWSCTWNYGSCEGIVAFHMANESFQLIIGPSLSGQHFRHRSVWVFKERLAMVVSVVDFEGNPSGNVEVWTMMEYTVEDSWTMLHSFGPLNGLRPISIPNDEKIFFRNDQGLLISFQFKDHKLQKYGRQLVDISNIHDNMGVLRYVETLVTLE